jgi:hypothetical protein
MKVNSVLFWLLSVFFAILSIVYALWSMSDPIAAQFTGPGGFENVTGQPEWVGTIGLALSSILSVFLGFYLQRTMRDQGGVLPEDRMDADIDDGDAEQGHFSPWSWWPPVLALALALVFLGLAVGVWIAFIGAPIVLIALVGWNYEYYRGNFAR